MFTVEDRKIRAVDQALEVLAQGIGNAIHQKFGSEAIEALINESPSLKGYQRQLPIHIHKPSKKADDGEGIAHEDSQH